MTGSRRKRKPVFPMLEMRRSGAANGFEWLPSSACFDPLQTFGEWATFAMMEKQKLIAWIDRDLQALRHGSYAAPLVLLPGFASLAAFGFHPLPLSFSVAWGVGWFALYLWRFVVLCRRADAVYDRRTKFLLAKEYRASESASAASKRRKRRRVQRKAE